MFIFYQFTPDMVKSIERSLISARQYRARTERLFNYWYWYKSFYKRDSNGTTTASVISPYNSSKAR